MAFGQLLGSAISKAVKALTSKSSSSSSTPKPSTNTKTSSSSGGSGSKSYSSSSNNKPRGMNDYGDVNFSGSPLGKPKDNNYDVGAYVKYNSDGSVKIGSNGQPEFEYRPTTYYNGQGQATYNPTSTGTNKGSKQPWGQEKDTQYYDTPMYNVTSPGSNKTTKMSKGMADQAFANMVKGGYAIQADYDKYISSAGIGKGYNLSNSYIQSDNTQMRNQWENDRYSKDPDGTLLARAQEQDNYLRGEHYKNTGEQLPPDYFINNGQIKLPGYTPGNNPYGEGSPYQGKNAGYDPSGQGSLYFDQEAYDMQMMREEEERRLQEEQQAYMDFYNKTLMQNTYSTPDLGESTPSIPPPVDPKIKEAELAELYRQNESKNPTSPYYVPGNTFQQEGGNPQDRAISKYLDDLMKQQLKQGGK